MIPPPLPPVDTPTHARVVPPRHIASGDGGTIDEFIPCCDGPKVCSLAHRCARASHGPAASRTSIPPLAIYPGLAASPARENHRTAARTSGAIGTTSASPSNVPGPNRVLAEVPVSGSPPRVCFTDKGPPGGVDVEMVDEEVTPRCRENPAPTDDPPSNDPMACDHSCVDTPTPCPHASASSSPGNIPRLRISYMPCKSMLAILIAGSNPPLTIACASRSQSYPMPSQL